ncbi:hypothetical protein IMZ31_24355 (plasmid) [Pontibacillus sp. ALD_SL1]|uniref:hypothetical protein n=1 Tax=Pontibacillus sp. ALD_SL1 TaxID=2777185 RepID=UPI001A9781CB|nr:hypothetical protein [Pontibacillus sp. ALD_SL1]QST02586.1 hypothetical protein IMZ31_24355 [Pontibacillus sp. ALD_SL1]
MVKGTHSDWQKTFDKIIERESENVGVTVNQKTEQFYIATKNGWKPVVGHRITVGPYEFSAVPKKNALVLSEVSSGMNIHSIPMNDGVIRSTDSKESTMRYLQGIGRILEKMVRDMDNFEQRILEGQKKAVAHCGEKPPTEEADTDWVFSESNGIH